MHNFTKLISLLLCLCLCLSFAGCGKNDLPPESSAEESSSETSSAPAEPLKPQLAVNPLTGLETLAPEDVGFRPVAISINNIRVAQSVQTGLDKADVVFETVVEGGITRLLAIFKAPTADIGRIGSVRSARVVFADLTASMNAVLCYHGQDDYHFPTRSSALGLKRIEINSTTTGERVKNGKSSEHTLYTSGEKLRNAMVSKGYDKNYETKPWLNFSSEKTASANPAKSVTVKFNGTSNSSFTYNEETGTYVRSVSGTVLKSYFTGNETSFSNVFVLYTNTYPYGATHNNGSKCTHTKVELGGGSGYYVTKGGYEKITWSKSGDKSPLKFMTENGSELTVTPGKSYICIADKSDSSFTAQ